MAEFDHRDYFTGKDIRAFRKQAGWTQQELATRSGFARGAVSHWENRTGPINGVAVSRFAQALKDLGYPIQPYGTRKIITVHNVMTPIIEVHPLRPDDKRCKALNRKGERCKAKAINGRGVCRNHGGLSTGPKSEAGKERIRQAQIKRWSEYRAMKCFPTDTHAHAPAS